MSRQPQHLAARPRRRPLRRHPVLTGLVAVALLFGVTTGSWLAYLNHQLASVARVQLHVPANQRPRPAAHQDATVAAAPTRPLNILIGGVDAGQPSIADEVASGHWVPGSHRSDTIMILHVTANRKHAYLLSIPRDSWVHIDGFGPSKVNAAFSYGGPSLYVKTIEQLTGLRIDHLALIDWGGFKDVTRALGGVRVYIPHTVYDDSQRYTWTAGWHRLAGKRALKYVRTRHGLPGGDFDRIRRQQNFLRQVMHKLMSNGTLTNPVTLTGVVGAITSHLTVDAGWSTGDIRSLALSLRGLSSRQVTFMTIPTQCCRTIDGQSTVTVQHRQLKALMAAVASDHLARYLHRHGGDVLGRSRNVS